MSLPPLTVAILAGGAATRLGGRDKGLEPLGGQPLIAWVIDAVAAMNTDTTSVAPTFESSPSRRGRGGDGFPRLATSNTIGAASTAPNLLIVANRHLGDYSRYALTIGDIVAGFHGPLAGVATALAACTTPWLLTVPVDCPDPPRDLARRLAEATLEYDAAAFVAHDGERRQPLFALYARDLAASAAVAVDAGQGVWQWQTSIGARELDFSDRRRQFRNLNTPEEFAAYAAEHRLES
ncbi:molybdenum cofactor guanylyltransferase [Dokdonella soli]|uniref:Molybdenum cofactor guanylyltransferase n=1 Tax=Dokdonella soli TaxID=529810 RepID=A0ABN1ICP1_9GAMM